MPFKEYRDVAEAGLVFPINGKEYLVPPMGIDDGLRLIGVISGDDAKSMDNESFFTLTLGSALDEMKADNVPMPSVARAALTVLADIREGRAVAEIMWETGNIPERLAAYMAAKTEELTASTESPSTGEAPSTPSPASTSTTSSRKATRPAKRAPKKAAKSPGPSSSSSST